MAQLNYLIQRHTGTHSGLHQWSDCGTSFSYEKDVYGNSGYQTRSKAREDLDRLRILHPTQTYRLIKITK